MGKKIINKHKVIRVGRNKNTYVAACCIEINECIFFGTGAILGEHLYIMKDGVYYRYLVKGVGRNSDNLVCQKLYKANPF